MADIDHWLVVADEFDPDDPAGCFTIEHRLDCLFERQEREGEAYVLLYQCAVAQEAQDAGIEYLFAHRDNPDPYWRAEVLAPGRYKIEVWAETYSNGPGGVEYDGGLRTIQEGT